METKKATEGHSVLALAYSPRKKKRPWDEEDLPGPFFDLAVVALFMVFGVASFIL